MNMIPSIGQGKGSKRNVARFNVNDYAYDGHIVQCLTGFIAHLSITYLSMTRQRTSIMNIMDVIKARILRDYPGITEEELQIRLSIAEKALKQLFE